MAEKNDDMELQRRHWGMTVQHGHLNNPVESDDGIASEIEEEAFEVAMKLWWQELGDAPGLAYAVGQIERCETSGRLHGQIYTEWKSPIRGKTLANRYPASMKPRWASRDVCRAYHKKSETRVAKLGEFGEWRADKVAGTQSPKQRAIQYIVKDGLGARDIAAIDPECYFTHHRSINELLTARKALMDDSDFDIADLNYLNPEREEKGNSLDEEE